MQQIVGVNEGRSAIYEDQLILPGEREPAVAGANELLVQTRTRKCRYELNARGAHIGQVSHDRCLRNRRVGSDVRLWTRVRTVQVE